MISGLFSSSSIAAAAADEVKPLNPPVFLDLGVDIIVTSGL